MTGSRGTGSRALQRNESSGLNELPGVRAGAGSDCEPKWQTVLILGIVVSVVYVAVFLCSCVKRSSAKNR